MRARWLRYLRSSATRTLWIVTALVALILIAVFAIGEIRQHHQKSPGSDEAAYITRVNRLQGLATGSLVQMNVAYAAFGKPGGSSPTELRKLQRAAADLHALRTRIAKVEAPKDAYALRARLLKLLDMQTAFARDVAQFAAYLPRASAAEHTADLARQTLLAALRTAKTANAQARAFDAYAAAALGAAGQLAKLHASPLFDVARATEASRLRQLARIAGEAAQALRAKSRTGVQKAIATFAQASASTTTALRLRQAAIAYNRRVAAIEAQRKLLDREETRLQKSL